MKNRTRKRRIGTTIVEMAFVAPLTLFIVLGIVDLGMAIWTYNNIAEAVREGGRYAQVHGSKYSIWYASQAQPAGTPLASGPAANDASVEGVVRSYAIVNQTNLTVLSSWPNGNNNPNSPVAVEANYAYSPLLLLGLGKLTLHTKSIMYINY